MPQRLANIWATVVRIVIRIMEVESLGIPIAILIVIEILIRVVVAVTVTKIGTLMDVIAGTGEIVAARLLPVVDVTRLNIGAAEVIQEALLEAVVPHVVEVVLGIMMHHLLGLQRLRSPLVGDLS